MWSLKQKLNQSCRNDLVTNLPRFKLSSSAGKVRLVAFWDSRGIILVHCMPKDRNVTARYYSEVILKINI